MRYSINKNSTAPAYMQLYAMLKRDITEGIYPYGGKLPSKRMLSEETGVSVITAEHAYGILCDEGFAEARERSGYFSVYKEKEFNTVADIAKESVKAVNMHAAHEGFPFSVFAKTVRRVLLDYGESIMIKSPNHGCAELRGALSSYLKRSAGIAVRPEQIIIGSGAEYLYGLIVQLLGRDRVFALEDPSYEKIRRVYQANGVRCEMLRFGRGGIRTSELEGSSAAVLHITPFKSFPSGITADASKRREYLNWAAMRDGYLIEDNYDSELTVSSKNEDTVFSLDTYGRVIYINTFSRTVAPSVRIGYMVIPDRLLSEFEARLGFYSCTVPVFEQYVLAELINSGDFERHINRVRRKRRHAAGGRI